MGIFDLFRQPSTENEPEVILLSKQVGLLYRSNQVSEGRRILTQIIRIIKTNPSELKKINDFSSLGEAIIIMFSENLLDDMESFHMMSNLGYLCYSKAVEKDIKNPDLVKSRLLIMHIGHNPIKDTILQSFDLLAEGIVAVNHRIQNQMAPTKALNIFHQMELSDLETHPIIYRSVEMFSSMRSELHEKLSGRSNLTKEEINKIISEGKANHSKLTKFLYNKILVQQDLDFY